MEAISSFIQKHRGRIVGTGGDSVLADFASVVDATRCAVEIQEALKERNKELPEDRRMEFRIGINLGDVVEEGDTIYGDGVNVAARLESLAEAGGICISGMVYENIKNKLAFGYENIGEQTVKNIKDPVRVYRVLMGPGVKKVEKSLGRMVKGKRALTLGVLVAFVVIAAGVTLWQFYLRPAPQKVEVASKEKMAFPLPDKPSIAVLPFTNMSGDPKQEFFSDGITEDIITALSKVPKLFVIARNSTFTYKGKPIKIKQVSEELGIRYVLEGSVQRSGDRVRITAQLIDALSGHHLWSERYDRDLKDLFALQDEVTLRILTALQVKLTEGEQASPGEKFFRGKHGLECYLKIWEANYYFQLMSLEGANKARIIAEEIVTKWPEEPWGYTLLGTAHYWDIWFGITKSPQESLKKFKALAEKDLAIDNSNFRAHGLLGYAYCYLREYDKAVAEGKRGMELMPNVAYANENYAWLLQYAGHYKEAITFFHKSIRLNPIGNSLDYQGLGNCYNALDRFEEAVSAWKQAIRVSPNNNVAHLGLVSSYILMGREKEARAEAAEVLRIRPDFSLDQWEKACRSIYKDQSGLDRYISTLRKVGLK
jgi:adenylate cyclase